MKLNKILLVALLAIAPITAGAALYNVFDQTTTILNASTTVSAGDSYKFKPNLPHRYVQATLRAASAVSATALIRCSTDNISFASAVAITMTLANPADGSAIQTVCPVVRAEVTAISGVGATVTVTVSQ